MSNTMRAMVQDRYGSADVLEVRNIDRPEIEDGEVWCACTRLASTEVSGIS